MALPLQRCFGVRISAICTARPVGIDRQLLLLIPGLWVLQPVQTALLISARTICRRQMADYLMR